MPNNADRVCPFLDEACNKKCRLWTEQSDCAIKSLARCAATLADDGVRARCNDGRLLTFKLVADKRTADKSLNCPIHDYDCTKGVCLLWGKSIGCAIDSLAKSAITLADRGLEEVTCEEGHKVNLSSSSLANGYAGLR
jgi:hypothetical protein